MKRKLGFVFSVLAFLTPFAIGIVNVLIHKTTVSYVEYMINFTNGTIFGSIFEWVFALISFVLLKKIKKNNASKVVMIIDIIMIVAGLGCSLCLVLAFCIK